MTRIVKQYDDRRIEFLEATKEFFFTVGYAKMSVQKLTEKIGVAKGTFYHYFKSKEDLLSQWVLHEMAPIITYQAEIADDPNYDAVTKLNMIFQQGRDWKAQHMDMMITLLKVMHDDHNIRLRTEMTRQSAALSHTILEKVIRQGVEEGAFVSRFPAELARKLPKIAQLFSEDIADLILQSHQGKDISFNKAFRIVTVWQEVIERMLGAPQGSLVFVDKKFLKAMLHHIKKADEAESIALAAMDNPAQSSVSIKADIS